ncbi:hypothetical protein LMG3458_05552 [Achromobacter deleyi]|uniref:3-phenylpropionate-dihydrodiol/cinnamic acid-dihydrodiol dehydrogenase n=1 Tax=Achromobacter deleyi TaxID=1353891 RepID=A0A6S7AM58_9BURK|nr:oxidoreductase [Achromobacter deleyi]CAB3738784.1 hypothetical protein LMG3458_05552 [Achromobacter deleyi]CAB3901989.1 hypothetical protein LMG3482_04352 [Achromobacter deleyi]CAB3906408.1 hypothetical protein LMG3481_04542 [Achromobacter deleyi]
MTTPLTQRVALVTGASSGIGEAIALRFASMGITTYAAARRVDRMAALRQHGIHVLPLDLTDAASIDDCVAQITARHGGVDILVNNAGYGAYGSVEEMPMDEARRQVEVNLFGLAAITRRVIPHMREQRWGKILNITSIGGVQAAPYGGWYHATKFAVEGLSSSLRQELAPFDVDVVLIRPGAIRSEWADIAAGHMQEVSGAGPYGAAVGALHALFTSERLQKMAGDPAVIADVAQRAISAVRPKSAYTAPRAARVMLWVGKLLGSDRLRDWSTRAFMGLPAKM